MLPHSQQWKYYLDVTNHRLIEVTDGVLFRTFDSGNTLRTFCNSYTVGFTCPAYMMSPVFLTHCSCSKDTMEISGIPAIARKTPNPQSLSMLPKTLDQRVRALNPALQTALGDYEFPPDSQMFYDSLVSSGRVALACV